MSKALKIMATVFDADGYEGLVVGKAGPNLTFINVLVVSHDGFAYKQNPPQWAGHGLPFWSIATCVGDHVPAGTDYFVVAVGTNEPLQGERFPVNVAPKSSPSEDAPVIGGLPADAVMSNILMLSRKVVTQ